VSATAERWGRAAAAALALLTRAPLPGRLVLDGGDLARGAGLFPVVGATVGALAGAAATLAADGGPLLAGGLGVLVMALATGALHLDGLADAADALGGRTPADALRIMRDHTLGAYGTTALVLDLLLKAAALGQLASGGDAILVAAVAGGLSRAAGAGLAAAAPYARIEGETVAATFTRAVGRGPAALAIVLAVLGALAAGTLGLALALAVVASAALVGARFVRRLGGVTGDVLGAAIEISETCALVTAALLSSA
jgi:adenosylcobinamide-GDP ribazoletransferase